MRSMGDTAGQAKAMATRWGRRLGWFVALAATLAASTVTRADPAPDDPMNKIPPSHATDQPQGQSDRDSPSSAPQTTPPLEPQSSAPSDTVADLPPATADPPATPPDASAPPETQPEPPTGQPDRTGSPPPDGATPS